MHTDVTGLLAITALGILGTGVTFYLNYRLIADEGPTSAATVGYLLPVVSVALGVLVLDESTGPRIWAGMAVVLTGVAMTRTRRTSGGDVAGPPSSPAEQPQPEPPAPTVQRPRRTAPRQHPEPAE
ncbi:DMT family transporter [Streptomyces sp. GTA36]